MIEATTPLMQQYQSVKSRYPHALLLFRLGDFYELFYEDAVTASKAVGLTLTSRDKASRIGVGLTPNSPAISAIRSLVPGCN